MGRLKLSSLDPIYLLAFQLLRHHRFTMFKDDRQRFLQQVSKKQFRTVYHNANTCG